MFINPLTPGAFCEKGISWTFWWLLGWISAKLALIWSKMHLHHDSLAFLSLASRFATFWLGHVQKVTYVFRLFDFWNFFCLSFFSFSFLFAAMIDLLLGLLVVENLLRKHHQDGQLLPWSSQVWWQQILVWVFCSTFWAFLCISQAPFGWSLWSGHHWKVEHRWCQFWSKVMTSEVEERPKLVTAGYGRHGSQWFKQLIYT